MNHHARNRWLAGVGALIAIAAFSSSSACDVSSIKGDFWFTANGTTQETLNGGNVRFVPFAELGRVSYDGKGAASIVEIVAFHKGQSGVKATGSYSVSSDCRGSVKWALTGHKYLQTYAILVVLASTEIQTIAFRVTDSGGSKPLSVFSQRKL